MKKSFIFGLFAAALALVSCNSTDGVDTSRQDGMSLNFFAMPPVEANSRAALTEDSEGLNFAYSVGDKVTVTNSENKSYEFTLGADNKFTCKDAKATEEPATWTAYFPSQEVSLLNQSGTLEDLAKYYLLMGSKDGITGADGLNITMEAKCAVLVIDNQKGKIDINVKCQVSGSRAAQQNQDIKWVKGLDAIDMANAVKATTTTTPTSLLTASAIGTYYVVVPAGIQLAIKDGDTVIKSTKTAGLKAGCYYNITITESAPAHEYVEITADYDFNSSTPATKLKWAKMNLGATTEKDWGDYFAWGETEPRYTGYTRTGNNISFAGWKSNHSSGYASADMPTYTGTTLDAAHDAATANWGGAWRMPTKDEFKAMYNATKWTWDSTDKGYYVTAKDVTLAGDKSNALLFFPAAGYVGSSGFANGGSSGCYWSSSLYTGNSERAYNLLFSSSSKDPSYFGFSRYYGMPVRPVSK